jgi:hypothetical protein
MPWIPKSNQIEHFPFNEFCDKLEPETYKQKIDYYRPKLYSSWMLPQILAHFGQFRVKVPCWREVARDNLGDSWRVGLWRFVTQHNRGDLVSKQTQNPKYGALTPLILAGIKEHQGIDYQCWDLHDPEFALLETNLRSAVQHPQPDLTREELLALREGVLTYKTGTREGQTKSAQSTTSTGAMRGTPLEPSPALQRIMLLQIWLAHPALRHPLMILDPRNPDKMPDALINSKNSAVFSSQVPNQVEPQTLPWM